MSSSEPVDGFYSYNWITLLSESIAVFVISELRMTYLLFL